MAAVKEMNDKARLVGINHVALEVGSIEEALSFYGQLFGLSLRGRSGKMDIRKPYSGSGRRTPFWPRGGR